MNCDPDLYIFTTNQQGHTGGQLMIKAHITVVHRTLGFGKIFFHRDGTKQHFSFSIAKFGEYRVPIRLGLQHFCADGFQRQTRFGRIGDTVGNQRAIAHGMGLQFQSKVTVESAQHQVFVVC